MVQDLHMIPLFQNRRDDCYGRKTEITCLKSGVIFKHIGRVLFTEYAGRFVLWVNKVSFIYHYENLYDEKILYIYLNALRFLQNDFFIFNKSDHIKNNRIDYFYIFSFELYCKK